MNDSMQLIQIIFNVFSGLIDMFWIPPCIRCLGALLCGLLVLSSDLHTYSTYQQYTLSLTTWGHLLIARIAWWLVSPDLYLSSLPSTFRFKLHHQTFHSLWLVSCGFPIYTFFCNCHLSEFVFKCVFSPAFTS